MADSSYEKNLTELSKMKVADLKAELKQRGLPITGNKNELVERLQLAMQDSSLSLDEVADEILDEDAVLGDEEIDETEDLITDTKPDSQEESAKQKLSTEDTNNTTKKIVLNRKNIVEEVKNETVQKKEEEVNSEENTKLSDEPQKKVIKLSKASDLDNKERLEMRAKKFGVPLTDEAKKVARAARFNVTTNNNKSSNSISPSVPADFETLKKRGERFGTNVSTLLQKAEIDDKKEKRKARFGLVKPAEKADATKIKLVK